MEIQRKESGSGGKFFVEENEKNVALMTYKKSGAGVITIDHTEVDKSLEGKGIGKRLVAEAVKFARENNLKIIAQCSFAKRIIDITPDFQDVLRQ